MANTENFMQRELGDLPDYENPPVVETVMALHFRPLRSWGTVQILDFWNESLRSEYPLAEQQPLFSPSVEKFDAGPPRSSMHVNVPLGAESTRFWFRSDDGENLAQVQNDWIAFNWRKIGDTADYPHFEHGKSRFERLYSALAAYAAATGEAKIDPIQAEVTYVNHVRNKEGSTPELGAVVHEVAAPRPGVFLPVPDAQTYSASYVAAAEGGEPYARFHVNAQTVFTNDDSDPLLMLRLTFRGTPSSADVNGVSNLLDTGHDWIVRGFDEITTDEYHKIWRRKERL